MAFLFGKKNKAQNPTGSTPKVNAEDIWSSPVKNATANKFSDKVNTDVVVKEMTSAVPETFNGPRGINPKVLERSIQQLEAELDERDKRPPQTYEIDGISAVAMNKAEEKFDKTVEEIKEKQSKIRYGRISEAHVDDIDQKVKELEEKYDYLTHKQENTDYGFDAISGDELDRIVSEYDIEKAAERKAIISRMPGLNEAQKQKIQEFFDNDVMAEPMDYVNSIPELTQKDLAKIRRELEKIYALDKETKPELKINAL